MRRRGAWVGGILALMAGTGGSARAQQPPPTTDGPATSASAVELIVIGGGREGDALLDTVRDRLARVGVVLEAHAVATLAEVAAIARGPAAARVQVDLRSAGDAVLVIEGKRQTPKQRILHRDPSAIVAREEIAEAIESAALSQLFADPEKRRGAATPDASPGSGDSTPSPPSTPAAVSPGPGPSGAPRAATNAVPGGAGAPPVLPDDLAHVNPTPRSPLSVEVSTLAGSGWFASASGPVVALGGDVALSSRNGWRLAFSARSVLPFMASADQVNCHASAFVLRGLAGIEIVRTARFALLSGAGGGADVVREEPSSPVFTPDVLGEATTRVDPMVSAFVATHMELVAGVALTFALVGDLDLMPSRYVVVRGAEVDSVLAPWRVRPTLLAGFTFTALGQPAFAAGNGR
jgi:multisubunit Na+/H+ antiporter MnhC subunit